LDSGGEGGGGCRQRGLPGGALGRDVGDEALPVLHRERREVDRLFQELLVGLFLLERDADAGDDAGGGQVGGGAPFPHRLREAPDRLRRRAAGGGGEARQHLDDEPVAVGGRAGGRHPTARE